MNPIPQIIKRKIGVVHILDLQGEFVGPWALRAKEEIASFIKSHNTKNLLINLRGLKTIDSLGVKAVVDNLTGVERSALVVGNLGVMEMFSRIAAARPLKFFKSEEEIIHHFGEDLVRWEEKSYEEKRRHQRLKTALPLEFSYEENGGETVFFHAVVTDLSVGGLLAEYLDLSRESFGKLNLDPTGMRILNLKIKLAENHQIEAKGRVVRAVFESDQVGMGIEFSQISDADLKKITTFLTGLPM